MEFGVWLHLSDLPSELALKPQLEGFSCVVFLLHAWYRLENLDVRVVVFGGTCHSHHGGLGVAYTVNSFCINYALVLFCTLVHCV